MNYNDFDHFGQNISNRVRDAIDSLNFEQLNRDIRQTADDVIFGVRKTIHQDYDPWNPGGKAYQRQQNAAKGNANPYSSTYRSSTYGYNAATGGMKTAQAGNTATKPATWRGQADYGFPVARSPKGEVSGLLFKIFGWLGFGGITFFYLILLMITMVEAFPGMVASALIVGTLPFEIAFAAMIGVGSAQRKRVKRFKKYIDAIKGKSLGTFKQLAALTGKTEKFTAKDVEKMLALNYFPEGHMDEQKTCLMTTNAMYEQYLELKEKSKEQERIARNQQVAGAFKEEPKVNVSEELDKLEALGKGYMEKIRKANDDIPDVEISNKLYRMEMIVGKIFEEVKKNPQKAGRLTQFENYYMPMTLKLLQTYRDFDCQPIQGENILKTKKDIEGTLDTINEAYEKLYDSMYQETVMDVASDISVLQTLLARDGLTKSDFNKSE